MIPNAGGSPRARRGATLLLAALALAALSLALAAPLRALRAEFEREAPRPRLGAASFERYAVASDNIEASSAGREILAAGGNAADAVVATALALGVAGPASSGLGGGGFLLYYRASDRSLTFVDFREEAPAALRADSFARREGESDEVAAERSRVGGLAVGVPGEPLGFQTILERFGSGRVSRLDVARPAARVAEGGWDATRYTSMYSGRMAEGLRRDRVLATFLPPGASEIPLGQRLRNPALARTIEAFGRLGAAPFYSGAIGAAIVREVQARGGVMTREDLAAYEVRLRAPLEAERFGHRFVVAPPPSAGGFTMLESLGLLERWLPRPREGARLRHALAESWKGGFLDRARYAGDPDHVAVPIERLTSAARIEARARRFDPFHAQPMEAYGLSDDAPASGDPSPRDHGTTHVCVVDAEGNVASLTTTVNIPFGARFTVAGMVMNDQMDDFAREVGALNAFELPGGSPNLPGPRRRPVSTMSPTIVFDDGEPILCIGGSGGSRIVTATEQVALFHLVLGDTLEAAVARPRVHHQGMPRTLAFERSMRGPSLDPRIVAGLEARGHELAAIDASAVVQAIRIVRDERGAITRLDAVADPRKEGDVRGR